MGPDIGGERRHVEIADQNHAVLGLGPIAAEPGGHGVEEIELVLELVVDRGIGDVAARRHIEIVQHDRLLRRTRPVEGDRQMPRVPAPANVAAFGTVKGSRESVATP